MCLDSVLSSFLWRCWQRMWSAFRTLRRTDGPSNECPRLSSVTDSCMTTDYWQGFRKDSKTCESEFATTMWWEEPWHSGTQVGQSTWGQRLEPRTHERASRPSASTTLYGSATFSTRTTFRKMRAGSFELPAKTTPGLSMSVTFLSNCTSCMTFVTPARPPTITDGWRFMELIKELFPVLGYPTMPTLTRAFSCPPPGVVVSRLCATRGVVCAKPDTRH